MGFWEWLARRQVEREERRKLLTPLGAQRDVPDKWVVEVNDILGRWDKMEESEMRVSLGVKGILVHPWRTEEGVKYDEIVRLLQAMLDYDIFNCTGNSRKYKDRPLRIKNLGTGDFIMLEALNLKANPKMSSHEEEMLAAMKQQQWSSPKTPPPLLPSKKYITP